MKATIVTIPDMITLEDYAPLSEVMSTKYVEQDNITEGELAKLAKDSDYLLLNYDVVKKLSKGFYDAVNGSTLKGISTDITGMDWASPQLALDSGIALMYLPDYCTDSVAEQILAEAYFHARGMQDESSALMKGRQPQQFLSRNLRDRICGVIGLGHIGRRFASLAQGVGMNVVGWNRSPVDDLD